MSTEQPRSGEGLQAHRGMADPATHQYASPVEREEARSEVYEYLHIRDLWRRIFPRAALVGLLAGLVATAFRQALSFGDALRNSLIDLSHQGAPLGIVFPVLFGATGSLLAVFLMRRFGGSPAAGQNCSVTVSVHCSNAYGSSANGPLPTGAGCEEG
jgi:uncharacterized membrane protein YeaQ/YmgE (transglycosylase-associated protein family)